MRVFVAGASGAVGRPLVSQLVEAGHSVVGTTRSERRADAIGTAGAEPVIVDALDLGALRREVRRAGPEVVVNQLTALPDVLDFRDKGLYDATNRLRGEVGPVLAQVAADAGARRLISQSVAFMYAPGTGLRSEEDAIIEPPPESLFAGGVRSMLSLERATLGTVGVDGVVLRYGWFYGPGTYYARDGGTAHEVRRRRFPIVGGGAGVFSFIHVNDAAAATVAALDRGAPGVYNVVDDDPAPQHTWLPQYAEALRAKPPRRVPAWVARLVAGKEVAAMTTALAGAANSKAKRELGWEPRYPSWRQGFREALG
ncbi:MAG: NAD-dependent epimerase/dehydratase family protein [Solirubrobacterales bacterium]